MDILNRLPGESDFEWKLRCCRAKFAHETDLGWREIVDLLGLDIHSDTFRREAKGIIEYDYFLHGKESVHRRILSISDAHIPFNLPISIFAKYAGCVDDLVFNGDLLDCQSISSFPRMYRIDLVEEMVAARKYILDVINMIGPKKVHFVVGNHEKRLGRYLSERLNDDLLRIMPDNPLDLIICDGFNDKDQINKTRTWYSPLSEVLSESGIEIDYSGDWSCIIGNTIFTHPLSYSSGMLKTTQKAVDHFLRKNRDFTSIVLGHTHKLGSYFQGNIQMFEQGCTCDLSKLNYADGKLALPNQNGFIYVCQDLSGNVITDKTKLVKI